MEEEARAFARELLERQPELAEFYDIYGIKGSVWFLQEQPEGAILIVLTDVIAPRPFAQSYSGSERKFDRWYKDNVRRISGVDPDHQPLGPSTREIFRWPGKAPD